MFLRLKVSIGAVSAHSRKDTAYLKQSYFNRICIEIWYSRLTVSDMSLESKVTLSISTCFMPGLRVSIVYSNNCMTHSMAFLYSVVWFFFYHFYLATNMLGDIFCLWFFFHLFYMLFYVYNLSAARCFVLICSLS